MPPTPMPRPARPSRSHRFERLPEAMVESWRLADGSRLVWRPVRTQDAAHLARFLGGLSRETRFQRFLGAVHHDEATLIAQMTDIDEQHHQAFVALHATAEGETMVADARYVVAADGESADFAIVVADGWQNRGVGTHLLQLLSEAAARRQLRWLRGDVRKDNQPMLRLMKRCGFFRAPHPEDEAMVQGVKLLLPPYPLSPFADSAFVADLPDAAPGPRQ